MEIIAHINIDRPEGRKIVEKLRNYPDVVSFEKNHINEPETAYETRKNRKQRARRVCNIRGV